MSFGSSLSDVVLLVQLAWRTVQNSRKACGEHAEITCEITSLHMNLQRIERESEKVESPINRPSDTCREDLAPIVNGCGKTLDVLDRILEKYNALSDRERSKGKLWKAVRFGNGELANVKDLRLKLIYYTANLSLFLNMVSMGSMGVVEKQMYEAGGDLKEIRRAVNNITAHLLSGANKEGSVLTEYADDDKAVWRAFRRELVKEGFSSDVIREHKTTIQAYVKELGSRGILDDEDLEDSGNVSEEIEDKEPTQVTPQSREEAMGSFESKSGAARDAVSSSSAIFAKTDRSYDLEKAFARIDELNEENKEFARINRLFEEEKETRERMEQFHKSQQIESANLTMSNVSDTLPSITQADAEINSVAESDSREVEKVDDRTNRHPSSAPIPLGQSLPEIAEGDTWYKGPFQYYKYDYISGRFLYTLVDCAEDFERLSNPLRARSKTLEFQAEAKGFLKVAELRTEMHRSPANRMLKLASLFHDPNQGIPPGLLLVIDKGHPNSIINDVLVWCLHRVDARPENWRTKKWRPRRGNADGDKSKHSTVPPAASSAVEHQQDPSGTAERGETEKDDEFQRTGKDTRTEVHKSWGELLKEAKAMGKVRYTVAAGTL